MTARRRRLGLRARITVIFALGALLLSATVALGTFTLARARLLNDTEATARREAFGNTVDLRARLQSVPPEQLEQVEVTPGTEAPATDPASEDTATDQIIDEVDPVIATTEPSLDRTGAETSMGAGDEQFSVDVDEVRDLLEAGRPTTTVASDSPTSVASGTDQGSSATNEPALGQLAPVEAEPIDAITSILEDLRPDRAQSLLVFAGRDRSLSGLCQTDIPAGVLRIVAAGGVAEQRIVFNGEPSIVIGLPVTGLDATYFEVSSLTDVEGTLNSLQVILGGTALAASLAGAALGWYSARRALQPLTDVSLAAASIAIGEFETRLDARDDPDLASLTASFNDMVDALKARMERDGRFASDVSHELRSPLMTLAASVGVLEGRKHEMPEPARQAVDLLTHDVRRFERLVGDLLEISRIDVGAVVLDKSAVFLSEFLRFVVAQSRAPDVRLDVRPQDTQLVVNVDKRRLAQAVTNLLDNAVKYADGPTSIGFRPAGSRVQIFVEDSGPGVRPDDRARIFDRFTRAGGDAGRRDVATGVGLGLSLVSEHIRLHGGSVNVVDRPDGRTGARFVIDLPIGEQLDFDEQDEEMAT